MKKVMLLLLLASSVYVQAQSLKDALFSGKLKNDAGTVIRKGDDLSSKMDTARKATPEETVKTKTVVPQADPASKNENPSTTDAAMVTVGTDTAATETASKPANAVKDNNALLKTYMDSLVSTLKTEALPSKKVKSGSYYVLVSYSIGTDGQITVNDVFLSPENDFLQKQVKDRLAIDTPRLNPVLSSTGTPRKVTKKYNFTLVKE